jgi:hypothetical protein
MTAVFHDPIRTARRVARRGLRRLLCAARVAATVGVVASASCSRPSRAPANPPDAGGEAVPAAPGAPATTPPAGGESSSGGTAPGASAEEPTATITLIDPGRSPRRRLRYAWRTQQKEQLTLELRTALSETVGDAGMSEVVLPPVHIVIAIEPQSVSADGELLSYAWRVTSASSSSAAGAPAQIAEGMRLEVAAVEHMAGTGIVDGQGLSRKVSADPAAPSDAGATGATGQMVEQVRQTLRDMAAPLPAEEVGQGARWRKLSQLAAKDTRITQTDAFTLLALQGNSGTLDDVLAQTAPPQVLRAPGAPEGAEARMESMLASGDAKTHFRLSRLVPQMKFEGTTVMVLSGAAVPVATRHMTVTLRVEIALSGSTP